MLLSQASSQPFTWGGAGLGEPPTPTQQGSSGPCQVSWPVPHTDERTQDRSRTQGWAERAAVPRAASLPPPPRRRSPLHPTVPGPPQCGGEQRRRKPALSPRYPPPTPPGWAEPAPVNWIKGRGRGGGSRAEAAPPLPSERPEPGPAPLALLEAGRDPRVPRLK